MTREEYIDFANALKNNYTIDFDKLPEFCDMAISTLEGVCRNCKWWKDSDGKYRRGIGAESKCPINTEIVCNGHGYCYVFEPKGAESEDEE